MARSTESTAPQAERDEAVETIWSWYEERRIHLLGRTAGLRNDLWTIQRLGEAGLSASLVRRVELALSNGDGAIRGNAVEFLVLIDRPDILVPEMPRLVADPDPVVRRNAAMAAAECNMTHLAQTLADAAATDPDEQAPETLASAAVRLVDDADLDAMLSAFSSKLRSSAFAAVGRHRGRARQLRYLLGMAQMSNSLLNQVASVRSEWDSAETEMLGEAWGATDGHGMEHDVLAVLSRKPKAAIRGRLKRSVASSDLYRLKRVLDLVGDDDLAELEASSPAAATVLTEYRANWRGSSGAPTPRRLAPSDPDLRDVVASGDDEALLRYAPKASQTEVAELSPSQRDQLRSQIQTIWDQQRNAGHSPATAVRRTKAGGLRADTHTAFWLWDWATYVYPTLLPDEWLAVAASDYPADVSDWLQKAYDPSFEPLLLERIEAADVTELRGLLRGTPLPWSASVASTFASRCLDPAQDEEIQERCVHGLLDDNGEILVRAAPRTPTPMINRALVEAGDCAAERRLLEADLEAGPVPLERHDDRKPWLRYVSCRENGALVLECVHRLLLGGSTTDDIEPYLGALDRCLGADAIAAYDDLMNDKALEHAKWLWFSRQQCVETLAERQALERLPSTMADFVTMLEAT